MQLDTEPLCRICEKAGRITPAVLTDHIIPHKGSESLFWNDGNHQSLCDLCHRQKSAREDGALGNPIKARG